MSRKVKIFFPVDVPSPEKAKELIDEVGPYVDVLKVGLELEKNVGTPAMAALAKSYGKEVFADVKLIDIPNTVKGAAKGLVSQRVDYFNVMAVGGKTMMMAAAEGAEEKAKELGIPKPKIIAVTVLTSLNFDELIMLNIGMGGYPRDYTTVKEIVSGRPGAEQDYITDVVMDWAETAMSAKMDCVLSSPKEVEAMRKRWPSVEIICPGIRPPWAPADDQKRTMSPYEAVKAGVDGLVIGRPIRKPPEGMTREEAVKKIREDIDKALSEEEGVVGGLA